MANIKLPDGSIKQIPDGASVRDLAESIGKRLVQAAIVGKVDGKLVDLSYKLTGDHEVQIITDRDPDGLYVLRHSSATQVKLLVQEQIGQIHIALEDNGTGFDEQDVLRGTSGSLTRGIGLRALREELFALNGQFNIISGPGGTRMEIILPATENE